METAVLYDRGMVELAEHVIERPIAELQAGMAAGDYTSVELVEAYFARIEALDANGPKLNSVIERNPDAQKAANAARDAKEHPPLILDPNSRIPGQKYKLADGRIARWEVNPATGKYGLNVLSAAQIGQAPVVAPKASVAADAADDEDLED